MKNLFKTLVIAGLTILCFQSQAQIKFGIKAGFNFSDIAVKYATLDLEPATKLKFGFHIGGSVDISLVKVLSLQTGILFTTKGYRRNLKKDLLPNIYVNGYDKLSMNYLEIPLHLVIKIKKFQIYAGPYAAVAIGGKRKFDYTYNTPAGFAISVGDTYIYKPKLGKVDPDDIADDERAFKALDLGADIGIGYKLGPILINAGFSIGLGNLTPKFDGDPVDPKDWKKTNRIFSISASFFFGK